MNLITLALGAAFFILAFMIIGGSLNYVNSNTAQANKTSNPNCIEIAYEINDITYAVELKTLSFWIKQNTDFSNKPIPGLSIRPDGTSDLVPITFKKPVSNGMTEYVNITDMNITGDLFYVSPIGCTSEYEKRCYISKGTCS